MKTKKLGLEERIASIEERNKRVEADKAWELSFGQKRLVELARAMLNPHKLLMLDEPIAGVNPKIREEISGILLGLKKKGETILLIEHDMNFVLGIADGVVVMDEGKVIARGKLGQIKNNKKVIEAYLGE
jgi:branched-chain amino acid transport system ATP-binding protein